MLKINLSVRAHKFLQKLPAKHERQIVTKISLLAQEPLPPDSKLLVGHAPLRRADMGEYRIIYYAEHLVLYVVLVGKRNDSDVYKRLNRL